MKPNARLTAFEILLLVIGTLSGVCFLVFRETLPPMVRIFLKVIPLALMAAWMLSRRVDRQNWAIFTGLLFALAGDIAMDIPGDTVFILGVVLNMLALVFYTIYFIQSDHSGDWLRLLPFVVIIGVIDVIIFPNLGKFTIPVLVYSLLYVVFLWRSSARIGDPTITPLSQWICFGSCVVITVSDSLLGLSLFGPKPAGFDTYYLSMFLWWLGQLLMTITAEIRERTLRAQRAAAVGAAA